MLNVSLSLVFESKISVLAMQGLESWENAHQAYTTPVLAPQQNAAASPQVSHLLTAMEGKKGLIVVGELLRAEDSLACLQIAKALKWPVAVDVLSGTMSDIKPQ